MHQDVNPTIVSQDQKEPTSYSAFIYAVLIPSLFLIIIPFILALLLPSVFPILKIGNVFSPEYWTELMQVFLVTTPTGISAIGLSFNLSIAPGYVFAFYYGSKYGLPGTNKYFDRKRARIMINEYEFINRVLFAEIFILIVITILFYSLSDQQKQTYLWPIFGNGFHLLQLTLMFTIYSIFFYLLPSYLRRDFRFYFARKCIAEAKIKDDPVVMINYLIAGLSSYNKYLKRNLNLQFDDIRVSSNIATSSDDKKRIVNTIDASFGDNDKLKPANCLSTFSNLEPKQQFLVKKQLSTRIKEIGTFLAAIIPVLIAVLQLTFPEYFQNLANS
jgi:hypothetical protein